jgi:ADP-heptose:LPS heptosyltransferase
VAKSKPPHLLVIRLSAMGDIAMTVPVLLALTQQYPSVRITLLTRAFFAPIFSSIPRVTVYSVNVKGKHKGFFGLWKLAKELRTLDIDATADLHHVLRSTILKQFLRFSGIPVKQLNKGRSAKKALTRAKNKIFTPLKTTHQRYAEVFKVLGFPIQLEAKHVLEPVLLSEETRTTLGLSQKKLIGIAPFAAFKGKTYPLELMEKVIHGLQDLKDYEMVLFGGGEKEKAQLEIWENRFEHCISAVGKIAFSEELTLISNLSVMLSMDSGNGHLAAMYNVPTVTLWGVTHPYAGFYPFNQMGNTLISDRTKYPEIPTSVYGNKFPPGYEKAMETIAPEKILKKIFEILNRTS